MRADVKGQSFGSFNGESLILTLTIRTSELTSVAVEVNNGIKVRVKTKGLK